MSIKVKICGINSPAAAAAAAGADFAGFVFYPPSPRHLALGEAAALAATLPPRVERVALMVDPDDAALARVLAGFRPDFLQLHGRESPARVAAIGAAFGLKIIKAMAIAEAADLGMAAAYEGIADWLLFDARPPSRPGALPGGNAAAFDWRLLAGRSFSRPWLLSGGLTPENVGEAIRVSGAPAVDVSSGVEDRPGHKDPSRITAFIAGARGGGC
ncbi:MAG: phosphoribosylanthranilate isomerase [Pseudomonadota bacterium]